MTPLALIFFFHRDRVRTTVNVLGDSFGAGIVQHLSRGELITSHNYSEEGLPNGDTTERDLQNGGKPGATGFANVDDNSETRF